ncbi:YciI family protein [Falsiroseomonas sp. E2-1-a20]|uniref:YciI family protein n=1 Tax=Falsiroseomonas sp. E2-1-a20 TaxID=3239300 RepID=UPI003F40769C
MGRRPILPCRHDFRHATGHAILRDTDPKGAARMLFLIQCTQVAEGAGIRAAHYEAHRAYLRASPVDLKLSGPMVTDEAETPIGSVFIVDVPDRAAAEAFASGDPFAKAGLFEKVTVTRFLDITRGRPAFGPKGE